MWNVRKSCTILKNFQEIWDELQRNVNKILEKLGETCKKCMKSVRD